MMDFDNFGSTAVGQPLRPIGQGRSRSSGHGQAGRQASSLKFFTQGELQGDHRRGPEPALHPAARALELVNEFEDLFTEGAGLMDNAKMMESILEEGLTPDEVDGLLGRRTAFQAYETRYLGPPAGCGRGLHQPLPAEGACRRRSPISCR